MVATSIDPQLLFRAQAACGGTTQAAAVGGWEWTEPHVKGTKADVLVNDFQEIPYKTWRAVAVVNNFNNFVEVGWIRWEPYGASTSHPYKTWKNNGVLNTEIFNTTNLLLGVNHTFRVHDADGSSYWSFAWASTSLGNELASFNNGESVTQSERDCSTDIMFARFRNLQKCPNTGCTWTDYEGLQEYDTGSQPSDYQFCWLSKTSYDVKATC